MAWYPLFIALLTLLATARLTRLVVEDSITQPIRKWINRRAEPRLIDGNVVLGPRLWRFLTALTDCTWCVSIWIAFVTTLTYMAWATDECPFDWDFGQIFIWFCAWMTTSQLTGYLAEWLDSPPAHKTHTIRLIDEHKTTT